MSSIWDPKNILDSLGGGKKEQKRSVRVAEVIRNELAVLLIEKVRDPKLDTVAISRVHVTDDLKYARLYYTVRGSDKDKQQAGKALDRAKGFMRTHLAKSLNLRHTPSLQFFYDETADKVEEVEKLFQEIALERKDEKDS